MDESYPPQAVEWLTGPSARSVLEVGAGRLSPVLERLGHDVRPAHRKGPIDLLDRSVDVVICADSFDRLDLDETLPEIARVLRPGGILGVLFNDRDEAIPWVRRLGRLLGSAPKKRDAEALVTSTLFGFVDEMSCRHWQTINSDSLAGLVAAEPAVEKLDANAREAKLAEVEEFYADYGRGVDGMQLPWITSGFKASVTDQPWVTPRDGDGDEDAGRASAGEDAPEKSSDGTDMDTLLIDFR